MKNKPTPRQSKQVFSIGTAIWLIIMLTVSAYSSAVAENATWAMDAPSTNWHEAGNWTPNTVPDGPDDVATFSTSATRDPSVFSSTELNALTFDEVASVYDIIIDGEAALTISGAGILNNSGVTQSMSLLAVTGDPIGGAGLIFTNHANAGGGMLYVIYPASSRGQASYVEFHDSSSAASGIFIAAASAEGDSDGGMILFADRSTAAKGNFTTRGSLSARGKSAVTLFTEDATAGDGVFLSGEAMRVGGGPGLTQFFDRSSAGEATLTSNGSAATGAAGGVTVFFDHATGANATLIANGGSEPGAISFESTSDGGKARIMLPGGELDVSGHAAPGLTIGSLEGDGSVLLGANALSVGSNNLSTTFAGAMQGDGSLTKVGTGTLTLSNTNTYAGGTSVREGTLLVRTGKGSATGTGPVQVNGGTFGGRSNITGSVTVGSGSGTGAFLAPGINGPGTLVIRNALTFKSDGTYNCDLSLSKSKADQVVCKGITIESGAQLALNARGNQTLANGTVFTVLENKTRQHISGTFGNLADGAILSVTGNNLQASYEGGDGNDLTLTVE